MKKPVRRFVVVVATALCLFVAMYVMAGPEPRHGGETDNYGQWWEGSKKCERFAMEPIVRLLSAIPVREPGGDTELHSASFISAASLVKSHRVQFLIATVPDPVQSGMYYAADRTIEAVQRGIESGGTNEQWLRDRFWSPWSTEETGTAADDAEKKLREECRARMPGVMTFRNERTFGFDPRGPSSEALVLFLVGESPTLGINRFALREALDFIEAASRDALAEIRIVGPTYSGSAASLFAELQSFHDVDAGAMRRSEGKPKAMAADPGATADASAPCFTIVSGTATREQTKDRLDTCGGKEGGDLVACTRACGSSAGPRLAFHATTIPDGVRFEQFYAFLKEDLGVETTDGGAAGCKLTHVALLKETSTAYSLTGTRGDAGVDAAVATSTIADGGERIALSESTPVGCVPELEMSFPPHVSNVRRAYDKQENESAAKVASSAERGLLPALTPSLDEPGEPHDVLRSLSPRTVYSNDLLIQNIIDALKQREIRFVGLFATDRSDIIFLANQIHKNAADVRLFTFASELLYTHPSYQAALNGMMVTSTYPLLIEHEAKDGRLAFFSNEQEEGVYNATVAILGNKNAMRDYSGSGDAGARPPLWISVIGRGGAFPLETVTSWKDPKDYVVTREPKAPPPAAPALKTPPPPLWRIVYVVVSVLLAYVALVYLTAMSLFAQRLWRRARKLMKERLANEAARATEAPASSLPNDLVEKAHLVPTFPPLSSLFYPCVNARVGVRKEAYTLTLFGFLLGTYVPIDALHSKSSDNHFAGIVIIALLAACVLMSLVRLVWVLYPALDAKTTHASDPPRWPDFALAGVAVGMTVLTTLLAIHVGLRDSICGPAGFCQRAMALDSGVSAVTPLLFATGILFLWTMCTIDRLRMVDGLCPNGLDQLHAKLEREGRECRIPDPHGVPPVSRALALFARPDAPLDIVIRETSLIKTLMTPVRDIFVRLWCFPIAAVPAYAFLRLRPLSTIEVHKPWIGANALASILLGLCALLVFDAILTIVIVSFRLRKLLSRLARHSLGDAYTRLPASLSRSLERQLSGSVPDVDELATPVHQLRMLANSDAALAAVSKRAVAAFDEERRDLARGAGYIVLGASKTVRELMDASATIIDELAREWATRKVEEADLEPCDDEEERAKKAAAADAKKKLVELRESYVASLVTMFVHQYVRPLRPLMMVAVGGSILFLFMIASYVFEPRNLIMTFLWGLVLSAAAVVSYVFQALDKDELLSRIAKSTPGKVTLDRSFFLRAVTWAALPILSLVAVQFPGVGNALFSWLEPVLKALR